MIFTTDWFLLFAAIAVALFWLLPRGVTRLWALGVACVFFHYHFAGPAGVIPIIVLMVVTYGAALSRNRLACAAAMLLCVAALCFYKYALFLIGAVVNPWSAALAAQLTTGTRQILPGAPPLAVSFFTFEFVHYLYDVRRGAQPIRSPIKFLLFSIFFPSLVAGPIKRFEQFIPELDRACSGRASAALFADGFFRIGLGFFKKIALADTLTLYIDHSLGGFAEASLWGRWIFIAALGLRILFDFSGYSDIAIGTARLLGIRLPENFNWPYLAGNLRDFWQRWHISLSSWIRDYVYIPLGGSRHGPLRRLINALIAFALCGLWHGPAWNFLFWGLFHGIGLAVTHTYSRIPVVGTGLAKAFEKEPVVPWLVTQVYVGLGWLLFFYPLEQALTMMKLAIGLK
jgi:alginate O-acetyltransferase complex protein AlgI